MTTQPIHHDQNGVEHGLLTINEAADLLRAPVATLRYWRNIDYGPHSFRIGRGIRYWRYDILDWLRQQSGGHGPHAA